jgi:hypothetical protein
MKKKTYKLKSKLNHGIVYGAWLEDNNWVWIDRDGSKVYMSKELYEISGEW